MAISRSPFSRSDSVRPSASSAGPTRAAMLGLSYALVSRRDVSTITSYFLIQGWRKTSFNVIRLDGSGASIPVINSWRTVRKGASTKAYGDWHTKHVSPETTPWIVVEDFSCQVSCILVRILRRLVPGSTLGPIS